MSQSVSRWVTIASCVSLTLLPSPLLAQQSEATPAATPIISEATPSCNAIFEDYPPLVEVRDIQARPWSLADTKFSIEGVVQYIFASEEGEGFELGDDEEYRDLFRTRLGLVYGLPDGDTDVIDIGHYFDPVGVYPGDVVIVGGELVGTSTGETESGRVHVWPFMIADYVREVGATQDGTPTVNCVEATPGATPIVNRADLLSEEEVSAATPTAASSGEGGPLVISGSGSIVTQDFALEAGRYQVTLNLATGCCIQLYIYGPSGSEELLFNQIFSGAGGGTVADIYQVSEPGTYFLNSQLAEGEWTVTFEKR